jgi:hypothetical protein
MRNQIAAITAQNTTKTSKIEQLLLLGLTRTQVAELVANGNYGFVQNVFAKLRAQGRIGQVTLLSYTPTAFTRQFGVEIEAFGVDRELLIEKLEAAGILVETGLRSEAMPNAWKLTTDGSITGENAIEVVSPILQGADGLLQLRKVSEVLTQLRVKINKTCGAHIHFDAQNFDLQQWKNVLLNYEGFETLIDSMMPASRREGNNTYCRSFKTVTRFKEDVKNATTIEQLINAVPNRYYKLNTHAFTRYKTIEFRQHSGTIEFEKLENWILLLHNLVAFSKTKVAESFNFALLSTMLPETVANFYHNRINDLAA